MDWRSVQACFLGEGLHIPSRLDDTFYIRRTAGIIVQYYSTSETASMTFVVSGYEVAGRSCLRPGQCWAGVLMPVLAACVCDGPLLRRSAFCQVSRCLVSLMVC